MKPVTEKLIKQHQQHLSDNPHELQNYSSVYEHMLYYFTTILGMDEQQAWQHIQDFKSDLTCDVMKNVVKSDII
ncbi:hypothetical protein [Bacillus sp. 3255]|uniref:hypothetical protein n=1 Tax=Bacillus sp. 3255 TaxID=2817904 RepID=UPI00285A7E99|nr:hypothetical protein [Bacillus sp. 3255]MDR6879035.1 hypothetical protein [Bacillus sp. 3255]